MFGCGLVPTFGSDEFDRRFSEESVLQDQFFQKSVPVFAFDECAGEMNALSVSAGFILFGRNLAQNIVFNTGSAAGVSGSLAHEYAHQKQFDHNWLRPWESTSRTTELEADAFSGLYMGLTKGLSENEVRGYFATLAHFGDFDFNSPSHHGTPTNRIGAALLGLTVADDMIRTQQVPTWEQLHQFFVSFILSAQGIATTSMDQSAGGDSGLIMSDEGRHNLERIRLGQDPVVPRRSLAAGELRHLYPKR